MFGGEKGEDLLPMIEEAKAAGREIRPEHVEPELWMASQALIDLFWEINGWRKDGAMGPARIDLGDIREYCNFYHTMLGSVEVMAIRRIDDLYRGNWKAPPT